MLDKNGVEIQVGDKVCVHQFDKTSEARVVELFPDEPCENGGFWVDIEDHMGRTGMMSYVLEVIDDRLKA